jgi:hypothetical protein
MVETGVHGENYRPDTVKLYHIILYRIHLVQTVFEHTTKANKQFLPQLIKHETKIQDIIMTFEI